MGDTEDIILKQNNEQVSESVVPEQVVSDVDVSDVSTTTPAEDVSDVSTTTPAEDVSDVSTTTPAVDVSDVSTTTPAEDVSDVSGADPDVMIEEDDEEEEEKEEPENNYFEKINIENNESHEFKAEISQLMNLIINSFYSNKDIFIRELISNASDALDKKRHTHLTKNVVKDIKDYYIKITPYKNNNLFVIEDNGIGMNKDELTQNIGMIANSGTKKFMECMKKDKELNLIGQFGVGFYSAFLVADRVQVITKSEDTEQIYMWDSTANGTYTISEVVNMSDVLELSEDEEGFIHGTKIILHLKENEKEYLDENKIKNIIKTHSQFISYDIKFKSLNEGDKVKTWGVLNKDKPVWCKSQTEVSEEEYKSLYKNISNDYQDCLCYKHFTAEGTLEFKGIVYFPSHPPYDMFNNEERKSFKLYVKRVFIMDNCKELIPEWLSFAHGLVDTDDLPLNVSREILQQNKIIKVMRKKIVLKTIELLDDLAKDDEKYKAFYNNFSKNLKLAVYEESDEIKEKMGKHLRFYSNKGENLKSLDDYISGMKEGQDKIYYITGESKDFVENSVFLEGLNKKGYEVLYLIDTIDEYMTQNFKKYGGYDFGCVSKEDFKIEDTEKDESEDELCKKIKGLLDDRIEKVVISDRFVNSPCCLVTGSYGWSANMERIMKAQALNNNNLQSHMTPKKILEINKDHTIIKALKKHINNNREREVRDMVLLMYDIACVSSGFTLTNTNEFTKKLYRILEIGMGATDDDKMEEIPTDEPDEKDKMEEETEMEKVD